MSFRGISNLYLQFLKNKAMTKSLTDNTYVKVWSVSRINPSRGVWSGSTLLALKTGISIKHDNNKN